MNCSSKITVAILPALHVIDFYKSANGTVQFSGYEGRFLETILNSLKFQFDVLIPEDLEWGRLMPNGNWSGIIGMVFRGEADLGVSTLSITKDRLKVVDFTTPYAVEATSFAHRKTGIKSVFAYLYPFYWPVWVTLLSILITLTFLFQCLYGGKQPFAKIFLKLFANILGQAMKLDGDILKFKLLLSCWFIFTSIISFVYSASLLSFLTVPLQAIPIRNFQQLSDAVQKGSHRCFLLKGTSTIPFLLKASHEHLRSLGKTIVSNGWYYNVSDRATGDHISDRNVYILSQVAFDLFYGEPMFRSNIMISEEYLSIWQIAIAVNKEFCFKSKLNTIIERICSGGFLMKYIRDESFKILLEKSKEFFTVHENRQLTVTDMSGAFILLIIGYAVSFFALFVEYTLSRSSNAPS
ncbi:glutamate receptor ionotropic, delta-1 [Nephila pilipes]|uniref:Glutamate receptor ionotropic, delta-1 n=1 Tax=Nephila pilipes TaxID=299642 RepID=A0A8X6NWW7_NEPPI|nr:glutamate receptor ionotropic, delta-1 [Nephila pilipes]